MAGYTRQSIADIINGAEVTAPPLNAEFNQISDAFNGSTGHSHDGSTGNAPKIDLTTSVVGYLPAVHGGVGGKNNLTATTTPTVTDDASVGYAPGSMWENTTTGRVYICVGNTTGAAVWRELVQVQTGNVIEPVAHDTIDLGSPTVRFQDLYLSGGIAAATNIAAGGTLNILGATALQSTLAVTGNTTIGGTLGVTGQTTVGNLTASGTTVITSGDINSGTIDATVIGGSTPAAGTFTTVNANTSLTAATADINGGTIDGTAIGSSAPSTGAFTTASTTGLATLASVDINGGAIDNTAIGAATASTGKFTTVQSTGQATLATVDINGGAIDGTTIGGTVAAAGTFTTVAASGGISGNLTGNVTGNVTGAVTGNVTGNLTGNVTGNVTASSGTSTFNDVTINGGLNMNAGTAATITNLTSPTNTNDAATKGYVDTSIANLIDSSPSTLNTLNELAAALGDDPNFSTTITNSIATKLPLAGGSMTGVISMGTNKITALGDPTAAQDAATKNYVDTQDALQVSRSGDSMSGALAMGGNNITGLATPTADDHATNKSYVDGILGSATEAATSAANAATSEANAATSETNAANSATNAATDRATVEAIYDQFDDRYLGSKSAAPTVDNDGNALITGALYFNSTANIMYVYGSSGWVPAGSSVNGTTDRVTYTAVEGQTVFGATYDAGYVDVYMNGVKLVAGSDFTATDGTNITLSAGAVAGDIVDIVAYGTFVLADHYTKTEADSRYVNAAGDTMTGNLTFGDNDKAIFGAGSDLQIYHDGSNSYVADVGTGNLKVRGEDLRLEDTAGNRYLQGVAGGATTLYYAGSPVANTTSTGIDVTGTVTADGLVLETDNASIVFTGTTGNNFITAKQGLRIDIDNDNDQGATSFVISHDDGAANLFKADENGDISFYEDTGTTPKFVWDASAEVLGIGTSSPVEAGRLNIVQNVNTNVNGLDGIRIDDGASGVYAGFGLFSGTDLRITSGDAGGTADTNIVFRTAASGSEAESMRIDSSGNVLVGTTSPVTGSKITVSGGNITTDSAFNFGGSSSAPTSQAFMYRPSDRVLGFGTDNTERMRINADGSVGIATTSTIVNSTTASGLWYQADGYLAVARNGGTPLYANRTGGTDGDIVSFRKDGTTVGSIGNVSTSFFIESGVDYQAGFTFRSTDVLPRRSGASADNVMDLGDAAYRFDDIFATNGTIQTSDRNEKQDIDVLSEAEARVAQACKGLLRKFRWKDAVAEKGDDARIHFGIIAQDLQDAFAAEGLDAGRYAMFISSTWWEADEVIPAVEAVEAVDAVYEDVVIPAVLDEEGNEIEHERTEQRLVSEAVEAVEAQPERTVTHRYESAEEAPEGAVERTRLGVRYPELLAFIVAAL